MGSTRGSILYDVLKHDIRMLFFKETFIFCFRLKQSIVSSMCAVYVVCPQNSGIFRWIYTFACR